MNRQIPEGKLKEYLDRLEDLDRSADKLVELGQGLVMVSETSPQFNKYFEHNRGFAAGGIIEGVTLKSHDSSVTIYIFEEIRSS